MKLPVFIKLSVTFRKIICSRNLKLSVTFTKKICSIFMKLRITFTYSCSIKRKKETLSLFVLGVRNVIAKKAGQRFEVDVVQKMLIPKIAIKDKLQ